MFRDPLKSLNTTELISSWKGGRAYPQNPQFVLGQRNSAIPQGGVLIAGRFDVPIAVCLDVVVVDDLDDMGHNFFH